MIAGNSVPRYANGPQGIAYNSVNHLDMITGAESNSVVVFDPTAGVVQSFAQPLVLGTNSGPPTQMGAILFDPLNSQTFATNPINSTVTVFNTTLGGVVSQYRTLQLANGSGPVALALDTKTNRLFVGNTLNATLSIIDARTDTIVTTIGVGDGPSSVVYDPKQDAIYVADAASNNLTRVDPNTLATSSLIYPVLGSPLALAYEPKNDFIWVAEPNDIVIVNATNQALVASFALPAGSPSPGLLYDSVHSEIYILNAPSGAITAYAPDHSRQLSIALGGTLTFAAWDPHLAEVDVLDAASNQVVRVSDASQTFTGRVALGAAPGGTAFSPVNDALVVTDTVSNRVYELNSRNTTPGAVPVNRSFVVTGHPVDVAYDPDTGWLVVASTNPATVTALDPLTGAPVVVDRLGADPVGNPYTLWNVLYAQGLIWVTASSGTLFIFNASSLQKLQATQLGTGPASAPRMIAYDTSNRMIYVALQGDDRLQIMTTNTLQRAGQIAVAGAPAGVVYDSLDGYLFVVSSQSDQLSVVNPGTGAIVRTIPLGFLPGGEAFVAASDQVFVSSQRSNQITIVDASFLTPPFTLPVGSYPGAIGYSPVTGNLFVSDAASSTLSVVPVATPIRAPYTATLSVTPSTTDVGSVITISATASIPAWAVSIRYPTLPPGCVAGFTWVLFCHPSAVGANQSIRAALTNLAGDPVNLSQVVTIVPALAVVAFVATPTVVTLGSQVSLLVSVSGGVAPFRYAYQQVPSGCTASIGPAWNCTSNTPGTQVVQVTVTDSVGITALRTVNFTVHLITQLHVTVTPASTPLGQTVTIQVNATDGTPPYGYHYQGLPSGCASQNVSLLLCKPSVAGVFSVVVVVSDSGGFSRGAPPITLTIVAPSGPSSSTNTLYVGLIVVGAVAAGLVGLVLWRRSLAAQRRVAEADAGPPEELYGGRPSGVAAAAVGPAGMRGPAPPPPEVEPTTPRYFAPAEEEVVAPSPAPPPSSQGSRPPIRCPRCGALNEPWLTNCRNCTRPLAST